MKKLFITATILFSIVLIAESQAGIDSVIVKIQKNNTSLKALKKKIEAEKIGNKTGIYLNNPEAEFAYLWGAPSDLGNRTNITVTQSFDFPTAYAHRKKITKLKDHQADIQYKKELINITTKAKLYCSDIIYYNALLSEFSARLVHAESIAKSYKAKFDAGETNILEYNKAQLNYLTTSNELKKCKLEKELLTAELIKLNGGEEIEFNDSLYISEILPEDFDQWYSKAEEYSPVMQLIKQEIEIGKKEQQLTKSEALPKFYAGYMSEKLTDEQFQGITVGISIPLWENKNKIKYAKAKSFAVESLQEDKKIILYNELKSLYEKATGLSKIANDYRENVPKFDNTNFLKKALDAGEIDVIDYMLELSVFYDSFEKLSDTERDLHKTMILLYRFM